MKWFRFYTEALDDPKVQKLSPELFKFWVNILCLAAKNDGKLPPIEDVAFAFRASLDETKSAFHATFKAGLLQEFSNQYGKWYTPHNWAKRQYKSDTSTERVKRFRNAQRNTDVTPPEQNRTETEQNRTETEKKPKVSLADLSISHIQTWLDNKRKDGYYKNIDEVALLEYFKNWAANGKPKKDYVATFRNSFTWEDIEKKCPAKKNDGRISYEEYQKQMEEVLCNM